MIFTAVRLLLKLKSGYNRWSLHVLLSSHVSVVTFAFHMGIFLMEVLGLWNLCRHVQSKYSMQGKYRMY